MATIWANPWKGPNPCWIEEVECKWVISVWKATALVRPWRHVPFGTFLSCKLKEILISIWLFNEIFNFSVNPDSKDFPKKPSWRFLRATCGVKRIHYSQSLIGENSQEILRSFSIFLSFLGSSNKTHFRSVQICFEICLNDFLSFPFWFVFGCSFQVSFISKQTFACVGKVVELVNSSSSWFSHQSCIAAAPTYWKVGFFPSFLKLSDYLWFLAFEKQFKPIMVSKFIFPLPASCSSHPSWSTRFV